MSEDRWLCFKGDCLMRTNESNRDYMNKRRFNKKMEKVKRRRIDCQVCFEALAATLHHIDENHNNNKNSNLLPVCRECHIKIIIART